jgi:hypothetical protein
MEWAYFHLPGNGQIVLHVGPTYTNWECIRIQIAYHPYEAYTIAPIKFFSIINLMCME